MRAVEGHRLEQDLADNWAVFSGEHSFAQFFLIVFSLHRASLVGVI